MPTALFVAGVLASQLLSASLAQAQNRAANTEPDAAAWFEALEQHRPGINDDALHAIVAMSPRAFDEVRARLAARRKGESVESFNRLVHRGALMHLDAAMLMASVGPVDAGRTAATSRARPSAILTNDGGYSGVDVIGEHWEYGRLLIDLTLPRPEEDSWALLWYVASSAFMSNRSLLADLTPHLEKARKLFPRDPDILFVSGCYFETIASPRVRPLLEARALPYGVRVNAPSARESLIIAEGYFRRAAATRPDFAAARLRRGRALDRLGRHDDAVQEFRAIDSLTVDPAMKYLASLFEGGAQEALGHVSAAQALYEQAARQFPNAQSPYLALSRLARDRGDRAAALAAADRVFTRAGGDEMSDPWWTYHLFVIRNASVLLQALQRPFVKDLTPAGKE